MSKEYTIGMDTKKMFYDPDIKPAIIIEPGDTVIRESEDANLSHFLSEDDVWDHCLELKEASGGGSDPVCGPIYVNGAKEGDYLSIEILDVQAGIWRNGGYTSIQGEVGWFSNRRIPASQKATTRIINYDKDGKLIMNLEGGKEYLKIPANNFVGCIGVAPKYDRIPSDHMNREVCGNVDIPQFKKGATVVLRCNVDGGLLSIGDVHAAQGDGEITGCAVESQGRTKIRVSLIKKADMPYYGLPQVNNEKMIGSVGVCPHIDMNYCCMEGYADLIYRIEAEYGISQADAYMLLCIAGKIQIGNGLSAVCMIDRDILKKYKKEV